MERSLLPFEHLELMDDPTPRDGAVNMAIDEVLIGRLHDCALLRLYRWTEPSVSLGYFESLDEARHVARGRAIVRRWTGGGIVEHDHDLTYSLIVPRSSRFARIRGGESYRLIHDAVAQALDQIGYRTEMHAGMPAARSVHSLSHSCFEKPVPHDLLSDGRKVAGAAQRRTRDGLLHQGSIRIISRDGSANQDRPSRLAAVLPWVFGLNHRPRALDAIEFAAATDLSASKYATRQWLEKS